MSVIQTLRDKYATVVVVVVCISLVAFLLMDAFVGPKSFFHQDTDVGVVNGDGLQYAEFMQEVQNQEDMVRASNPDASLNEQDRNQIREQIWNKFIQDKLLGAEYEKLGIGFPSAELSDLTLTTDADPQIQNIPAFQNPQTGQFDPNRVSAFLQQLKNAPAGNQQAELQRRQWIQLEQYLRNSSLVRKFTSLITNAIYIPSWLAKENYTEQLTFADLSYVSVPYTTIADSSVKLSTEELQTYLDKHQKLYQQDAAVNFDYVSFDAIPSAGDSATILKQLNLLKSDMDTLDYNDVPGFISRNSEKKFYDGYTPVSMIDADEQKSIASLPKGGTFGPYYSQGLVSYAKMLDKKVIPDTVEIQHLLISNQNVPDSIAKNRVDSIENAIKGGADFAAMVDEFSEGSKQNGGELIITAGNPNIPPEISSFATDHKKGDMGVVKSQYGYHLIKIVSQKDFEEAYKIAYLSHSMDASQATDNEAYSAANKFKGLNQTREAYDKSIKEEGLQKQVANDVQTTDFQIQGIGPARELIRWAFGADVNEVSQVFSLGNHYVIAMLTDKKEKGPAKLEEVRPQIEAIVRRDKKAAQIAKTMKGSTLDEVAKAIKDTISYAQHIGFMTPFIPNSGFEPKVVGAAFNPNLKDGKLSDPVFGNNGVYVLKVDSLTMQEGDSTMVDQIANQTKGQLQQQVNAQLMDILKEEADIEDHRLKFF